VKPQLDKETGMTSYIDESGNKREINSSDVSQLVEDASIAPAQITMNGFFILSPLITTARARRERGKCITWIKKRG
jgi:hypothetical protein